MLVVSAAVAVAVAAQNIAAATAIFWIIETLPSSALAWPGALERLGNSSLPHYNVQAGDI
jgi:hypothetical protein